MQTQEKLGKLYIDVNPSTSLSLIDFEDSQELFSLVSKSRTSLRKWLPWVDYIHSQGDFSQLIQYYQNKHRNHPFIRQLKSP